MERDNREFRRNVTRISPEAEALLLKYSWPGNVRELRNAIERAMILGKGDEIPPTDFPPEVHGQPAKGQEMAEGIDLPPDGVSLEDVEHRLIKQALQAARGNQTRAAKLLGLSMDALRYRMKKFGFL